jgi:putative Holliday junction resolvase
MTAFLGLDYGKRRVGVAVGDDQRGIAFAHGTHREGHDGSVVDYLAAIISERDITTLVVGLPLRADGSEGEITTATRKFAALLEERLGLPVVLWDERFSSTEADRWLMDRRKKAKEDRDALAAEIILQSYLDSLRAQGDAP